MQTVLVGTGGFGAGWRGYFTGERAERVVALVDAVPEHNAAFAAAIGRPDVPQFAHLSDALDRVDAQLVVDSTPPRFREEIARPAFAAGCHLFVAKPLAETMEIGRRMVERAAAAGRQLGVGQQQRYYPVPQTLARLVREGAIGRPIVAYLDFYQRRRWDDRLIDVPSPLFVESAIHHFDLLRFVLDRRPQRVCAFGWTPAWTGAAGETAGAAWLELDGGIPALYRGSRSGRTDLDAALNTTWHGPWLIEGTDGVVRGDDRTGLFLNGRCVLPPEEASTGFDNARYISLDRFQEAVARNEPFEINGEDNLWVLAATYGAWLSASERRWIDLSPLVNGSENGTQGGGERGPLS
ncbi:MAG: Gfo/Idh/MocA family oxidoreductase [Chloroflexi bacterium]|nr:Gfo/Idh/MocA family oxidoreductase [Chloroflexota bacterium]